MNTGSKSNPAVLLFGPTGVGKTELLLDEFPSHTHVISVDSIQVYRGLDIGSAKPTAEQRRRRPHHLIDIREPDQSFDVGDFVAEADAAMETIGRRDGLACLTGGTAFYFVNWVKGLPATPPSTPETRKASLDLWNQVGELEFRSRLARIDEESARRIQVHDSYRLQRAWEVWLLSGRPLSSFSRTPVRRGPLFVMGLDRPREELWDRIERRVETMIDDGLEAEVRSLLDRGAHRGTPALKAIGYGEWLDWLLDGKGTRDQVVRDIIHHTRQYAKRQLTFFRSLEGVRWYHPSDTDRIISDLRTWTLTNHLPW